MRLRVVIDLETSKSVAEQMNRAGFEVIKEGERHTVKLPNRTIRSSHCHVKFQEPEPEHE